jgi:hypothetical protein
MITNVDWIDTKLLSIDLIIRPLSFSNNFSAKSCHICGLFAVLTKVFEEIGRATGMSVDEAKVGVMRTQCWTNVYLRILLVRLVAHEPYRLALCGTDTVYCLSACMDADKLLRFLNGYLI